ncbi:hypothetical protein PTTG_26979 [Puccinia triticina 1-1 BBBD Race 1]|uniref:Uncharacterized protein n=1 Tax=Puccinia triticina (isolate 1-1 / race 1 (BBBD)) TaxID=630390 RepID=A0A180GNY5_PUCT1|nr:hypothetical protein PTTG_26979 [Puccinia triticina 1-1 BBBD Race 1]
MWSKPLTKPSTLTLNTPRTLQAHRQRRLETNYFTTHPQHSQPARPTLAGDSPAPRSAHTARPQLATPRPAPPRPPRLPAPASGAFEDGLQRRLVEMYLEEEGLSVPTPDHWTRSHTELGWLRTGARKHILRRAPQSHPPASLTQRLVDQLLAEWVEQHVSHKKPLAYILGRPPSRSPDHHQPPGSLTNPVGRRRPIRRPHLHHPAARSDPAAGDGAMGHRALAHDEYVLPSSTSGARLGGRQAGPAVCVQGAGHRHRQRLHLELPGLPPSGSACGGGGCGPGGGRTGAGERGAAPDAPQPADGPGPAGEGPRLVLQPRPLSPTFVANLKQASQSLAGFDMLLSNPPYIPLAHYHALPRSVTGWESRLALTRARGQRSHPGLAAAPRPPPVEVGTTPSGDYGFFTQLPLRPQPARAPPGGTRRQPADKPLERPPTTDSTSTATSSSSSPLLASSNPTMPPSTTAQLVFEVGHGQAAPLKALLLHALPAELSHVRVLKDFAGVERTLLCY